MTITCSVYGLGLSVNVCLAGLRGLPPASGVDVSIEIGELPAGCDEPSSGAVPVHVSENTDERGTPVRVVSRTRDGHYRIDYADGTRVALTADGTRIWARGATPDVEDTATYLLGPVLGFVLRLRGINTLHASAVAIGDRACAFVGTSGSGKSSYAAAFAQRGHAVLCDDAAPLVEQAAGFLVQPAYPRVRLWPESVEGLFGDAEALPRIVEGWNKRFVDLAQAPFRFHREPLPLARIYLLDTLPGTPALAPVGEREALMSLIAESYATYALDRERRAAELEFLARLVQRVRVRRLRRGTTLRDAPATCELVLDDLRAGDAR